MRPGWHHGFSRHDVVAGGPATYLARSARAVAWQLVRGDVPTSSPATAPRYDKRRREVMGLAEKEANLYHEIEGKLRPLAPVRRHIEGLDKHANRQA
jgi:hypothetical protein